MCLYLEYRVEMSEPTPKHLSATNTPTISYHRSTQVLRVFWGCWKKEIFDKHKSLFGVNVIKLKINMLRLLISRYFVMYQRKHEKL